MLSWFYTDHNLITDWATAMIRVIWQGGIVLALVWLILLLFPKIHPTLRCWLWRLAYLKLLASFFGMPTFEIKSISPMEIPWTKDGAVFGVTFLKSNPVLQWMASKPSILNLVSPNFSVFSIPKFWFILWVLGLVGFGGYFLVLWYRYRKIRQGCYPASGTIHECSLEYLYSELCVGLKIKKAPRLFLSDSLASPSLQGLIHPKIILPVSFLLQYSLEELKLMLAHELAHYKRGDLFWNWLPLIARWLFFFHPLVWIAQREWKQLPEICSDRLAVGLTGIQSAEYGRVLLKATCGQVACQSANLRPWFNPKNQLVEYYSAESKRTLKKRLVALNYPNRVPGKIIVVSVLVLILFGIFSVLPWKLNLVGSPSILIYVQYINNYDLTIAGSILHGDKLAIKNFEVTIDDIILTPGDHSANSFDGYRRRIKSDLFNMDGQHQLKLLVKTNAGAFQEKYVFNLQAFREQTYGCWMNRTL